MVNGVFAAQFYMRRGDECEQRAVRPVYRLLKLTRDSLNLKGHALGEVGFRFTVIDEALLRVRAYVGRVEIPFNPDDEGEVFPYIMREKDGHTIVLVANRDQVVHGVLLSGWVSQYYDPRYSEGVQPHPKHAMAPANTLAPLTLPVACRRVV